MKIDLEGCIYFLAPFIPGLLIGGAILLLTVVYNTTINGGCVKVVELRSQAKITDVIE